MFSYFFITDIWTLLGCRCSGFPLNLRSRWKWQLFTSHVSFFVWPLITHNCSSIFPSAYFSFFWPHFCCVKLSLLAVSEVHERSWSSSNWPVCFFLFPNCPKSKFFFYRKLRFARSYHSSLLLDDHPPFHILLEELNLCSSKSFVFSDRIIHVYNLISEIISKAVFRRNVWIAAIHW